LQKVAKILQVLQKNFAKNKCSIIIFSYRDLTQHLQNLQNSFAKTIVLSSKTNVFCPSFAKNFWHPRRQIPFFSTSNPVNDPQTTY
jgi:hypothetical protein